MSDAALVDMTDLYDEPTPEHEDESETRPYGAVTDDDADDAPAEKRPVPTGPRTPLSELFSMGWGFAGYALVQSGDWRNVPSGRCMQLQAPLAGEHFDKLIAHTWVDKMLQPFAKSAEAVQGMGAIVGLPVLVGMYVRNEAMAPILEPFMRSMLETTLVEMEPMLRKQAAANRKAAKAMSDLSGTGLFDDMPKGSDPIDYLLQNLFAPPPGYVPSPDGDDDAEG